MISEDVPMRDVWGRFMVRNMSRIEMIPPADSRHGHVAAVDDDVPEVRRARLIGQLQGIGGPQRSVEAGEAGHWGRSLVGGRGLPSELVMANGLVRRGRGSGEGRSCLGRSMRTGVSWWAEERVGDRGGGDAHARAGC